MADTIDLFAHCVFIRSADGKLVIEWHNGQSLNAVTGASIQYIPVHMRMTGTLDNGDFTYDASRDVARMIAGGVNGKLAMVVAAMRKAVLAMPSSVVNLTECWIATVDDDVATVDAADFARLRDNSAAFAGVVQQAITILAMNGLSMLNKGHNYITSDKAWTRLVQATGLDDHFEKLGLADWEGSVFHDALHPFDLAWKARLVIEKSTPLSGHVHGVAMVRMPGVPAGTAVVGVTMAAIDDIIALKPTASNQLAPFRETLRCLLTRIKAEPLNWCVHIGGRGTAANLANVKLVEGNCAFVFGVASFLFDRKSTILKAQSLKNVAARNPARVKLGATYAEGLPDEELTADNVDTLLVGSSNAVAAYVNGLDAIPEGDYVFPPGNVTSEDPEDDLSDTGSDHSVEGVVEAPAA